MITNADRLVGVDNGSTALGMGVRDSSLPADRRDRVRVALMDDGIVESLGYARLAGSRTISILYRCLVARGAQTRRRRASTRTISILYRCLVAALVMMWPVQNGALYDRRPAAGLLKSGSSIDIPAAAKALSFQFKRGVYHNVQYAYSIRIPQGMKIKTNPPPSPQHGFAILISNSPNRTIWVNADYNVLDWESLSEAGDFHIEDLQDKHGPIVEEKRYPSKLASLPAMILLTRQEGRDMAEPMISECVIALRKGKRTGESGIVYEISMETTEQYYSADHLIFETLRADLRLEKQPH